MNNKTIALLILFLLAIVFGPFATIWAINTLFGTEIAYNIATWAAVFWLLIAVNGAKASS